jgi:membrane-bound lytic murein transglycosylase F
MIQKSRFFILFLLLVFSSCLHKKPEQSTQPATSDLENIIKSDTLRVATMYGSTSYFLFRDEYMGFDYEMATNLAQFLHVNLKIYIARSESEMSKMLLRHKVDLVAYNTIETKELKQNFLFVLPQNESYQVLVQNQGSHALSDVTELAGKTVYVTPNSIYFSRLQSLNEEIGGTIKIVTAADSLSVDDLIDMVDDKKIDYTLAYHNVANLHKSYQRNLDCRMSVGFDQRNGWLVRNSSPELKETIEKWEKLPETVSLQSDLFSKYWEKSPYFIMRKVKIPKGAISPYDHLFKRFSKEIDWDWRLLASIAFHESEFNSTQVSWAGAAGLMQLMPRTASNFGLDKESVFNPELNIEAGVQYIKSLNMSFRRIENKDERIKFILAAYNSGPAHVLDAMALANKYGKNPHIWFNQVEYFLLKLNEPEFYNDPVVKYGYFGSKETFRYVHNTLDTYDKYLRKK